MSSNHAGKGFSLIDLVVVISILVILAGALIPRVTHRMARSRDARRLADMATIRNAIEQYFADKHTYPAASADAAAGGYDTSADGSFVPALVDAGYLPEAVRDPINDSNYQYRYKLYAKDANGCNGDGPYYVLGVRSFETTDAAAAAGGGFKCSGKDWGTEFAFVTGGGASSAK